MLSSTKIPEDDDITNHKIKALELNATQFQSQMKPLFNENTKLKQHIISLNFFMEERKLQLSNLISDTGPQGEDRVLVKAVADFKQICDLLEEEIIRQNNTIIEGNEAKLNQQQLIKQLKLQLEQETERHFLEKQQLIDSNRRQSENYKIQLQVAAQKHNHLLMKIEDLYSHLQEQKLNEKKLQKQFKEELDLKTLKLNNELAQLKFEKADQMEKFEAERRSYLKQLEVFSAKLNEVKLEIINDYEYKIQSQKLKLENQIQKLKEDCQDYKNQSLAFIEKNKVLQFQIDKYIPYVASLEKDVQDQKYKVFLYDEQLKLRDSKLVQKDILIDQLNEQIKRLKVEKAQSGARENSKRQTATNQIKTTSPDKHSMQQSQNRNQQQIRQSVIKQRDVVKQGSNPESGLQSSQKRTSLQQKDEFIFEETTIEQYVESNRQEILQSIHDSKQHSRSSSVEQEQPLVQMTLIKIVNNDSQLTDEQQQLKHRSMQTTQIQWDFKKDVATQYDLIITNEESSNSQYEAQISRLKNDVVRITDEYEFKLKCKQDEINDFKEQIKQLNLKFETNQEQPQNDQLQQIKEQLQKKDLKITELQRTIKEQNEKIKSNLESEKLYETLIEDINFKLKEKEDEILQLQQQFQNKMKIFEQDHQQEQKRLRDLNESLKQAHQEELENLNNQHHLDQEQLKQERKKLSETKAEHEVYIKSTNDLLEQAKSKEFLLDSYRRELLKTNEIVKYLSLEIENYKKINNIFKSKQDHITQSFLYNGMGFLPTEVQDKIKQKMNKVKFKQSVPSNIQRDAYAMNFQLQKLNKMKPAKLVAMNQTVLDIKKQDAKFKLEVFNESNIDILPKLNSKNVPEHLERSHSDQKNQKILNRNIRSKTQQEEYPEISDPKRIINDINQKELLLIQRSQMLLSQLNITSDNYKQNQRKLNHSTCKI